MSDDDALEAAISTQRQVNSAVRTTPPKAPGAGEAEADEVRQVGARAVAYMAECMGMTESATDQEQNWILSHLHGFGVSELRRGRAVATPPPAASPGTDASGAGLVTSSGSAIVAAFDGRPGWGERSARASLLKAAAWLRERANEYGVLRHAADAIEEEVGRGG